MNQKSVQTLWRSTVAMLLSLPVVVGLAVFAQVRSSAPELAVWGFIAVSSFLTVATSFSFVSLFL